MGEVGMELKYAQPILRVAARDGSITREIIGSAGRRRRSIHTAWQHPENRRVSTVKIEIDIARCRVASQHFGPVERKNACAEITGAGAIELVVCHVIAIGPHAKLWIIRKLR